MIYLRVSSKEQAEEGFSIPAQKRLLEEYASRNDLRVAQVYADVETAKRAGRTSFGEMIRYLRTNKSCRTILVEKTDRLYRNIRDWVTVDELCVDVHLVKEGTILTDKARSSEKFMHGIRVLMAKNYIENLGEETSKGMLEKARQGLYPSQAPLGYSNNREAGSIEPDPERASAYQANLRGVRGGGICPSKPRHS
ncbi:MAG: recombinase family protein [bacterium]|nr:recombinase family protein [bacterium]